MYHAASASRADLPPRCPLERPRARDLRDRRCPRRDARRVLQPHCRRPPADRRQARPLHRDDGPRADTTRTVAARTRGSDRQPARQGALARRGRTPRAVGRAGTSPRARASTRDRPTRSTGSPDAGRDRTIDRSGDRGPGNGDDERAAVDLAANASSTARLAQRSRPRRASMPTGWSRWIDRVVDDTTESRCIDLSAPIPKDALLRNDGRPVVRVGRSTVRSRPRRSSTRKPTHRLGRPPPRLRRRRQPGRHRSQHRRPERSPGVRPRQPSPGSDDLVLVVGPAGTGKTTALAPAVAQLRADGRAVFGVAPSATAAEVLAERDRRAGRHARQAPHRAPAQPATRTALRPARRGDRDRRRGRDDAHRQARRTGRPRRHEGLARRARRRPAAVLRRRTRWHVRTPRRHVRRRSNSTASTASTTTGNATPASDCGAVTSTVAEIYDDHGRLHGGTQTQMERASVARWWELRQAGQVAALDDADQRSDRAPQPTLPADPHPSRRDRPDRAVRDGWPVHAARRRRDRHPAQRPTARPPTRGDMVRNRATWTVDAIHPDGSLTATGRNGTVRLPARVRRRARRAGLRPHRASPAKAAPCKAGLLFMDGTTDVRNLYVAMTRGTETNEAFIVTTGEQTAVDVFAQSIATDWIDLPAHTRRDELQQTTSNPSTRPPRRTGATPGDGGAPRDHPCAHQRRTEGHRGTVRTEQCPARRGAGGTTHRRRRGRAHPSPSRP